MLSFGYKLYSMELAIFIGFCVKADVKFRNSILYLVV